MDEYFTNAEEKKSFVNDVFSSVVHKYDIFNDISSLGIHRLWKRRLLAMIPKGTYHYLDVACGSGDVAMGLYNALTKYGISKDGISLTCLDQNSNMLQKAQERFIDKNYYGSNIEFVASSAEAMPFADKSFDYITVSFGVRNFSDLKAGLKEMYRILKEGGSMFILELSNALPNPVLRHLYSFYLPLLPKVGDILVKDKKSYEYLVDSIKAFPDPQDFITMLNVAGFEFADHEGLTFGIANIYVAKKRLN